jgi:hypothetical protein
MSDQQPQEQTPKRRAGSINRYTTLGSSRTRERSNVDTSGSADAQTLESPNVDTPERLDVSTPEHIDTETSRSAHVQEQERSNVQEQERSNVEESRSTNVQELTHPGVQEEKRSGARTPSKRERHTIYFPPDLSEWVKIRAIKTKREISEVVTEAVERYRQQEEDI